MLLTHCAQHTLSTLRGRKYIPFIIVSDDESTRDLRSIYENEGRITKHQASFGNSVMYGAVTASVLEEYEVEITGKRDQAVLDWRVGNPSCLSRWAASKKMS